MRICALLLADKRGSYHCGPCSDQTQTLRGCSKRGKPRLTAATEYLSIPDPRNPDRPIRPTDCPRAYLGAQEARWLEMWGHLRASRDYLGLPAGQWPCRDAAAMSVLSEEVARLELQERNREAQAEARAYRPGPGMDLDQLGAWAKGVRHG